jgi:biotin carboxylase
MKLGLADQTAPRPPAILLLGEGAATQQIRDDLIALGLTVFQVPDLGLDPEISQLPKITDPDAGTRLKVLFSAFKKRDEFEAYDHLWIHPGVTIWGERPEIETWARQSGLAAISSSSRNLQLFWNIHQSLELAKSVGVPTLVLSDEPVTSTREIEQSIQRLMGEGRAVLPFVLKSAYRARGGFGVRVIRELEELEEWVPIWMNQLREGSGANLLFFERFLESARCFVQPFARTKEGTIEFFPVIDGSLMFEGRNWVEVCPAQSLDEDTRAKIEDYSGRFLDAADFVGVGNLVFLSNGIEVYFTEALGRLNFGFRLWESVARTKAVEWQVHTLAPALLRSVPKSMPKLEAGAEDGAPPICGINLKLYAEDTWLKVPHPGIVHELSQETDWSGSDYESVLYWGVRPGQDVDWRSSGALGQVFLFATDWRTALTRAREVLSSLWVSGGIQTNERFLHELLSHPWVEESMFFTGFVDEEFIPKQHPEASWLPVISAALAEIAPPLKENESFIWMNQRLPAQPPPIRWNQRLEIGPGALRGVKGYFQNAEGKPERICIFPVHDKRFMVRIRNWFFSIRRSERGRPLSLMALTSGRVHSVFFKERSNVPSKQTVLILETHQNLIPHRLPIPVTITALKVRAEDEVVVGQELLELERWEEKGETHG